MVCYVDAGTGMSETKSQTLVSSKKDLDELQDMTSRLKILSESLYSWCFRDIDTVLGKGGDTRICENDTDDFSMEG